MSRIAGRNGVVYLGIASSAATASPLPFVASWSINFSNEKIDVTAMQDANKVTVGGLPDASGDFGGWYDDASAQTYTAAIDSQARKFYLYPNTSTATQYFFGTIITDMSIDSDVNGAVGIKASWAAASGIAKVG